MERTLNLESQFKKGSTHKWKYGIKVLESLLKWGPYDPQLQSLPSKKISLKLLKKGIIVSTNRHLMHLSQLEEPKLTTPLINWMLDLQHRGKIRVHQCAVSIPRIRCIPTLKLRKIKEKWTLLHSKQVTSRKVKERWTLLQSKQVTSRDTGSVPIVVKVETITAEEFENIPSCSNVSPQWN